MENLLPLKKNLILEILLKPNLKVCFFYFLALITLSVFFYTEWPYITIHNAAQRRLWSMKWILFPHIMGGLTGFLIGPLQFSTRIRKHYVRFHRTMGKIYVLAIMSAAVFGILVNLNFPVPGQTTRATLEVITQASVWFVTTLLAWVTIRRKQIQLHKTWMARSYGMTFIFISSRVINPLPFFKQMDFNTFSIFLWLLIVSSLIIPDILLNWKAIFLNPKKARIAEQTIPMQRRGIPLLPGKGITGNPALED